MLIYAAFIISLSSLTFEVLLTRIFSIAQWNHLSFMVISIALFGFGASGTFLSLLDTRRKKWETQLSSIIALRVIILLYSATGIAAFISLVNIPLDYFRLPHEPVQTFYLLAAYLILTIPFFFAGLVISIAYASLPEKTGLIYLTTMAGSAAGAIIPFPVVPLIGEERLIILASLLPVILVPLAFTGPDVPTVTDGKGRIRSYSAAMMTAWVALIVFSGFIFFSGPDTITSVKSSPYKSLSQLLRFPDTRITGTSTSLKGRIDCVQSPFIRFAPGLSLKFTGSLPDQWAAFTDADNQFVFYNPEQIKASNFPAFTLSYAGYLQAGAPDRVLIVQNGGGAAIPCALISGATHITVVESDWRIARMIRGYYQLPVTNEPSRAFLARSDVRYDVIQLENWGTSIPGTAALTQEHLLTMDAFAGYLNHLTNAGVLIISRKLLLPPADSIRLWSTALESLKQTHMKDPHNHLAMLRSWDSFTLIVSKQPLVHTGKIVRFARKMNFDMVYLPGMTPSMANTFNIYKEPFHYNEITRVAQAYLNGSEKDFFKRYVLDTSPQSDLRPFPQRFLKWTRLKELYRSTGSRLYSLMMSGEIIVAAVFAEALVISAVLLIVPLFATRKTGTPPPAYQLLYFLCLGAGFMFIEMFFIKAYTFLFEDPVISFSVVISGILIFSGLGGYVSRYTGKTRLRAATGGLIALLIVTAAILEPLIAKCLELSAGVQYIIAVLVMFPIGFLMGLPFPIGMQYILGSPLQRTYAWAANGCASVLASILSAQIALSIGIPAILACALISYLLALICIVKSNVA